MDDHEPLIERLRGLGRQPIDPTTASGHLSSMAAAGGGGILRAVKLKVGAAFFAGLLAGGTGLATAGALPGPAQEVAHTALSKVGVDVPRRHGPARYNGPECGTDPQTHQAFRNHGQYVRSHAEDPNAGAARCGKPIQAGTATPDGTEAPAGAPGGKAGGAHVNHGKGKHDQPDDSTASSSTQPPSDASPTTTAQPTTTTTPTTTTAPPTTTAPTTTTAPPTTTSPTLGSTSGPGR